MLIVWGSWGCGLAVGIRGKGGEENELGAWNGDVFTSSLPSEEGAYCVIWGSDSLYCVGGPGLAIVPLPPPPPLFLPLSLWMSSALHFTALFSCLSIDFLNSASVIVVFQRDPTTIYRHIFAQCRGPSDASAEHIKFVTNFNPGMAVRVSSTGLLEADGFWVQPQRNHNHNTNKAWGTAAPSVLLTVNV